MQLPKFEDETAKFNWLADNLYTGALPRFTSLRYGAGLGVRYYTSFGPIRVDVGTPINPQPGDPRLAVYVSLGQAF